MHLIISFRDHEEMKRFQVGNKSESTLSSNITLKTNESLQ